MNAGRKTMLWTALAMTGLVACASQPHKDGMRNYQAFITQEQDAGPTSNGGRRVTVAAKDPLSTYITGRPSAIPTQLFSESLEQRANGDASSFENPFPRQEEIIRLMPKDYRSNPATTNNDPLEDPNLRPLKNYDRITTSIPIDRAFKGNEDFIRFSYAPSQTSNGWFGIHEELRAEDQTVMMRELGKWAFEQYKKSNGPLAGSLRTVDREVERFTTFGGVKIEPKISFKNGFSIGNWALGLKTRIGPGKLSAGYENGNSENGSGSSSYLEYRIDW